MAVVHKILVAIYHMLLKVWTPGPNGIYFLDGSKTPATFNLLNLRTHKISRVCDISGRVTAWGSGPSLSADGRSLVFGTADRIEGDLMLVLSFRKSTSLRTVDRVRIQFLGSIKMEITINPLDRMSSSRTSITSKESWPAAAAFTVRGQITRAIARHGEHRLLTTATWRASIGRRGRRIKA